MMVSHDLVEVSLRDGEEEISLKRPTAGTISSGPEVTVQPAPAALPSVSTTATTSIESPPDADLSPIASPMVGTFYAAGDPESPPFVQVGTHVHPGMVVCILEAMKVFNEIKSEAAGTVERVLVNNAQAVEYGQPLFLIRPR